MSNFFDRNLFGVIVLESDQDLEPIVAYTCYEDRWLLGMLTSLPEIYSPADWETYSLITAVHRLIRPFAIYVPQFRLFSRFVAHICFFFIRKSLYLSVWLPLHPGVLTKDLRELENDGLISRKQYSTIPPTVEYSLTEKGKTLIPALDTLYQWADDQMKAK